MSAPEGIYEELSEILAQRKDQVLDIEILPPPLSPLLHDGLSVGISKKALVQAFVTARAIFFSSIERFEKKGRQPLVDDTDEAAVPAGTNNVFDTKTCIASEVILLLDSEHLTACNWRKRRICHLKEEKSHVDSAGFIDAINAEIAFTTTLLRSPLHRHAKSPNLWQHRKWVISQALNVDVDMLSGLTSLRNPCMRTDERAIEEQILRTELSVVLKAGEYHLKNYYAFSYLREFMFLLGNTADRTTESKAVVPGLGRLSPMSGVYRVRQEARTIQLLAKTIVKEMHTWCFSHLGDVSGWMFLHFLLEVLGETAIQTAIVNETAHFALDVAWEGESLWTFVDLSVRKFGLSVDIGSSDGDNKERGLDDDSVSSRRGWMSWVAKAKALRVEKRPAA